jgi:glycosyltransferase involved in cell wall biosynthesis
MADIRARLSIGLPVYNGDKFLAAALDSLLSQTFGDFELIISDNASSDGTEEIGRRYAGLDGRIRYVRNQVNLGAAENFDRVFQLSASPYFKWAAHDDLCAPDYLQRCVDFLDREESVILCHARTREIDEHATPVRDYAAKPKLGSAKAHERFYECICVGHPQVHVFGVVRAAVLRRTRLIGSYASSDRVLLGELALRGRFHELPDILFYRRAHATQSYKMHPGRHSYQAWFDPRRAGKITFPHWRLLGEHLFSVARVPLPPGERLRCYLILVWWMRLQWKYLACNLILREPSRSFRKRSWVSPFSKA